MKMASLVFLVGVLVFPVAIQAGEPLRFIQKIHLPSVEGRIDHMSVDVQGQRLFVSALGNNTLEVLDLQAGKRLTSLTGLREPQGVFFVPKDNKIFVANGDDGTCRVFDGSSYKLLATVNFSSDADNIRYDPSQKQIYVGYGEGALGILDVTTGQKVARYPASCSPGVISVGKIRVEDFRQPARRQSHCRRCGPLERLRDRNLGARGASEFPDGTRRARPSASSL